MRNTMNQKLKKLKKQRTIQTKLPLESTDRHYSFGFLLGNY